MKLIVLLLAIYSLIFYQSYKIEKLKEEVVPAKQDLHVQKNLKNSRTAGKEYQNALLLITEDNPLRQSSERKRPLLRPLVFY